MKQELSKREKILIFCAAVLALFYLAFQFGFLPMYTRYTEALAERERLAEEKAIIEENIANKPSIVDDNNNAREKFDFIIFLTPQIIANIDQMREATKQALFFPSDAGQNRAQMSPIEEEVDQRFRELYEKSRRANK